MTAALAWVAALGALVAIVQQFIGTRLVTRFAAAPQAQPAETPPVSVLKPLCGVEPLTELALESFFLIDYPVYQLIFGVQSAADPVIAVVERLRRRYPARDVALVIDEALHGSNRKVSNLINIFAQASYDILVMADADIHVPPGFLSSVVAALEQPKVGLVTTAYTALPGTPHLVSRLGASQINYSFLPGVLLARKLGRQDCLGVTVALRRELLLAVGGLQAVANHLAEDQMLGRLVLSRGYTLTLAGVIPATTVPESSLRDLFHHELRWSRTIRSLAPIGFLGSALQLPLVWAMLCVVLARGWWPCWVGFLAVLLIRVILARQTDTALRLDSAKDGLISRAGMFLLREALTAGEFIASFFGNRVSWRGQQMRVDRGPPNGAPVQYARPAPAEPLLGDVVDNGQISP